MAEAVGTAFVELVLDGTKFSGQLKGAEDAVKKSATRMEQSFKGAESGIVSAASRISSAFLRVAGVLGVAFGVGAIVNYTKSAIMLAARVETLGIVLKEVGKNAGYTGAEMKKFVDDVKAMGITTQAAHQSVTRMAQAQMDLTQAGKLARIAQDAAVIGNINSSQAFDRLVLGIQRGETEILRTIGIQVNFEAAYAKTAAQLNKSVTSLTMAEKMQARMNAALLEGVKIEDVYAASMGTAGKLMSSMSRFTEELQLAFGELFGPALTSAISNVTEMLKGMNKEVTRMKDTGEWDALAQKISGPLQAALGGIMALYKALPAEVIGASGIGLVGAILFGWNVGGIIAALTLAMATFVKLEGLTKKLEGKTGALPKELGAALASMGLESGIAIPTSIELPATAGSAGNFTEWDRINAEKALERQIIDKKKAAKKIAEAEELRLQNEKTLRTQALASELAVLKTKNAETLALSKDKDSREINNLKSTGENKIAQMTRNGASEIAIAQETYNQSIAIAKKAKTDEIALAVLTNTLGTAEYKKEAANRSELEGLKFNATADRIKNEASLHSAQRIAEKTAGTKADNDKLEAANKLNTVILKNNEDVHKQMVGIQVAHDKEMNDVFYENRGAIIAVTEKSYDLRNYYEALSGKKTVEINEDVLDQMIEDYEDTFVGGWKKGLLELKNNMYTWGSAMYSIVNAFSYNAQSALSNVFLDQAKGQLKSFKDYWKAFSDDMLKIFTDMLARMVVEQAASDVLGMTQNKKTGSWSFSSDNNTGLIASIINAASSVWGSYHQGGMVKPIYAHTGLKLKSDEVPIVAQTGERVLSRAETIQYETLGENLAWSARAISDAAGDIKAAAMGMEKSSNALESTASFSGFNTSGGRSPGGALAGTLIGGALFGPIGAAIGAIAGGYYAQIANFVLETVGVIQTTTEKMGEIYNTPALTYGAAADAAAMAASSINMQTISTLMQDAVATGVALGIGESTYQSTEGTGTEGTGDGTGTGGIGEPGGPMGFHKGGWVRPLYAHKGGRLKRDEVPAVLQTGEYVESIEEAKAMSRGGVHFHYTNNGVNTSADVAEWMAGVMRKTQIGRRGDSYTVQPLTAKGIA